MTVSLYKAFSRMSLEIQSADLHWFISVEHSDSLTFVSWASATFEVLRKRGKKGELLPFLCPLPKHHPGY